MKKLITSLVTLVLVLSLAACESGDNTDNKINVPDSPTDLKSEDYKDAMTEKVPKTTKTPEVTETSEVSSDRTVSGFDTKTNKTITWGGIGFSLPSYFDVLDKGSTENWMHYYPDEEDYYASIVFRSTEYLGTEEDFYSQIPSMLKSILDSKDFANKELQNSEKVSIAGLPGWTITYFESDKGDGVISTGIDSFVYNINTGEVIAISLSYDSNDKSQYDYLGDYKKVLKTAKFLTELLDLNAINSTNSNKSDEKFVGKYYRVTGKIEQAIEPSDGFNAMVIINPDVMAKGMGSTLPLEINIWLTADEFEEIGGISSVGNQIDLSVKLTSISRNAISKDPAVKGYPIQLEFGEYD